LNTSLGKGQKFAMIFGVNPTTKNLSTVQRLDSQIGSSFSQSLLKIDLGAIAHWHIACSLGRPQQVCTQEM
jgi:hypothetical protein